MYKNRQVERNNATSGMKCLKVPHSFASSLTSGSMKVKGWQGKNLTEHKLSLHFYQPPQYPSIRTTVFLGLMPSVSKNACRMTYFKKKKKKAVAENLNRNLVFVTQKPSSSLLLALIPSCTACFQLHCFFRSPLFGTSRTLDPPPVLRVGSLDDYVFCIVLHLNFAPVQPSFDWPVQSLAAYFSTLDDPHLWPRTKWPPTKRNKRLPVERRCLLWPT